MDMQPIQSISNNTSSLSNNVPVNKGAMEKDSFWGKDGFTFGDVIDMINPMHHLPVVSKYYREHTEDDASEGSRLVGGALFGGLIGGVAGVFTSMANAAVRHETHQDVSEQIIAMAEESFENITASEKDSLSINSNEMAFIDNKSEDLNPFFAQTLNENSSYPAEFHIETTSRTREWGKV
ncbi:MAG: hypothetical protein OQL19_04755 [Gammaproteobacteria bacterium]|nr:hypothetical protein [Gammaproteobacteria bacterium]